MMSGIWCLPAVHIDIARVFNNVLPQQTQPLDSFSGEKTITNNYTNWYTKPPSTPITAYKSRNWNFRNSNYIKGNTNHLLRKYAHMNILRHNDLLNFIFILAHLRTLSSR